MFVCCLNNPVAYSDSKGTDARVCISADGAIDDTPWWDHSPSGGGVIYNYKAKAPDYSGDKFYTQIILRYAWEFTKKGSSWLWDAYMRAHNLQQQSQIQNAEALIDGVEYFVHNPKKAEVVLRDMAGASASVTATISVGLAGGPPVAIVVAVGVAAVAIWDVCWTISDITGDFQ